MLEKLLKDTISGQPFIRDTFYFYKKNIKHLIVIEGPTASGKTSLSVDLAKYFNTAIISADSRQFYKELEIGTAKPSIEEQNGIQHYFIDSHSVLDEVSSARFEREGLQILNELFKSNDVAILVGGSGMFIDALCYGLDNIPADPAIKAVIQKEYDEFGTHPLLDELKQKDPNYYNTIDRENPMRIIRAIEVIRITGKPYSELRKAKPKSRPFQIHKYVINHDRKILYDRINLRVDLMIKAGLIDEARSVIQHRGLASLNTVGYKEIFDYIDGNCTLEDAIERIKQNTRRYAKRQLTWFRRHKDAVWIDYDKNSKMIESILQNFNSTMQA
jgi:tRNA dimethylallyltransferase